MLRAGLLLTSLLLSATAVCAQPSTIFPEHGSNWLWMSGQVNVIFQSHGAFPARYSGPHSLRSSSEYATSTLLTLFTGVRIAARTWVLFDVESAGGRGISNALGLAGFTDLDVVRNPTLGAKPYLARLMVYHTIALGKDETAEPNALSPSRAQPVRRIEFRAGKFGTADFFDVNAVGSDSHFQFMNWTVDNNGAYDYAADTRGYTWGATVEYHDQHRACRFGEMLMPKVANGLELDWDIRHARAENVEVEQNLARVGDLRGVIRLLAYVNHANMGDYRESLRRFSAGLDPVPVIENTRQQGRVKYGVGVNIEQPVTPGVRLFGRWGWNEPHHESFAYTEVNDTVEAGADVSGAHWKRDEDRIGLAVVTSGLSDDHREYLAKGGTGFLLGDGALRYGREGIVETYYTAHLWKGVSAAGDLQHITNPGFNRDRGPVLVASARLHVEF